MATKRRKRKTIVRQVFITISSARHLPAMDPNGLCDCFCRIKLNDMVLGKTKTIYRNRFPRWDAKFGPFQVENPFQVFIVELEDEDISRNDLIGYASIDLAEVAMAKGRRLKNWFGVRRIEGEYKPWERRAKSEDEWIRENDGEFPVSKDNNKSEVLLHVSYKGDYYNEIEDLLKHMLQREKPLAPSADEIFRKLMEESCMHGDKEEVEVMEAKDQSLIRTIKNANKGVLQSPASKTTPCTPFSVPAMFSPSLDTFRKRPNTTVAGHVRLEEVPWPAQPGVKPFLLQAEEEARWKRDMFARRPPQPQKIVDAVVRSPTSVSSPRRHSTSHEKQISPRPPSSHLSLQATPLMRNRSFHPVQDTIKHCYVEAESGSVQAFGNHETLEEMQTATVNSLRPFKPLFLSRIQPVPPPPGVRSARFVEGSGSPGGEQVESYISMLIRIASVEANEGKGTQCKRSVFRAAETCERLVGAQSQFMLSTFWRCVQVLIKVELYDDAGSYASVKCRSSVVTFEFDATLSCTMIELF